MKLRKINKKAQAGLPVMQFFKIIIIVQLFYATCITMLAYSMPEDSLIYITSFSEVAGNIDLESVGQDVQDSLESQTNIPIIELGALVFYSGNILVDLLLNFAFALPQMIGLILNAIIQLIGIDTQLWALAQLFFSVVITVLYFLGIMQLLTGLRSGARIA